MGLPAMGLKEDLDMEQVLAIEPKKRRRLASSGYSSLAELKKALGVTDGSDAAPDGSKRIKFEDGAGESAARCSDTSRRPSAVHTSDRWHGHAHRRSDGRCCIRVRRRKRP